MNRVKKICFFVLFLSILTTACGMDPMGGGNADYSPMEPPNSQTADNNRAAPVDENDALPNSDDPKLGPVDGDLKPHRETAKLIREGEIRMEVTEYASTNRALHSLVAKWDGYISNENETGNSARMENTLLIRVPGQSFDTLVALIVGQGARVDHKRINARDVTEEFVDLNARIATKKAAEESYREILKQRRTLSEIVEMEELIRRVREEIESAEGRLRYLSDRVDYSSLTVTFYESGAVAQAVEHTAGFADNIKVAFLNGWNFILNGIVSLAYAWPMLVLGLIVFMFRRQIIRRLRSIRTPTAAN